MIELNILQNADGSIAWLNIALLLLFFAIGFFISRSRSRKTVSKLSSDSKEWSSKFRQTDNEYKSYKSGHEATFKQHEKIAAEMTTRVKSLEGDIKALADEKNKLLHRLQEREQEIKNYVRQAGDMEDKMKELQDEKVKQLHDLSDKLKHSNEEWHKAKAWEGKVQAAEEDARKARGALTEVQRKTVEFDLRLKAASEYAAKVQPLEATIKSMQEKYDALEKDLADKVSASNAAGTQVQEAQSTMIKLNNNIKELNAGLSEKQEVIDGLREKLKTVSETTSRIGGLETEIKTLKDTNANLQKELAERSSLLMQLTKELDKMQLVPPSPVKDSDIATDKAFHIKEQPVEGKAN